MKTLKRICPKLFPILGLIYFGWSAFGAPRGVSYDSTTTNVYQTTHQRFHSITNLGGTAGETAILNAEKKLVTTNAAGMRGLIGAAATAHTHVGTDVSFSDPDSLWTAGNVDAALAEMNDSINAGVANGAGAKVHWSQLLGVPAGFADGTDDGAGGSGAPVGTMVNTGASTQYAFPFYSDATGTNMEPSLITTDVTKTNLLAGGVNANVLSVTNLAQSLSNLGLGTEDAPNFTNVIVGTTNLADTLPLLATTVSVTATQTGSHASPSTTDPLAPGNLTGPSHVIWYGATGEIDLPAAASNTLKVICVYNTGAFTITIDPNGAEVIVREGTAQTGGVSMTLASGAGNFVWLLSDGARWITLGKNGTLAVGT